MDCAHHHVQHRAWVVPGALEPVVLRAHLDAYLVPEVVLHLVEVIVVLDVLQDVVLDVQLVAHHLVKDALLVEDVQDVVDVVPVVALVVPDVLEDAAQHVLDAPDVVAVLGLVENMG